MFLIWKFNGVVMEIYDEDAKIITNNFYDNKNKIKVGQMIFTSSGEGIIIQEVNEKTIIVEYKNKKYERDKAVLGKSLFISNPLNEEGRIKTNKSNDIVIGIEVGQRLYTRDGEEVIVSEINEKTINVEYKNKKFVRDKSVLGKTLFVTNPQENKSVFNSINFEEPKYEKQFEIIKEQEPENIFQGKSRLEEINEIELSVGGFKKNETHLYHDVYGEGVFVDFDSTNKYILVSFNNETKTFVYHDVIGKHLFVKKTDKLIKREEFLKNSKNKQEDLEEQKFFADVCEVADKFLKSANEEVRYIKWGYNDFSDSFDSSVYEKHQVAIKEVTLWENIKNNPYFARVDHGENLKFYIGRNAVEDLVIDWRDKICNLYYQYNIYVGNEKYNLSLVRDFDIISGICCGFNDKYSRKGDYGHYEVENNVISDEFLIKIISANRGDKKTHDIIQTIQRNQYDIITSEESKSMIVSGCAGSGKTMIMLHRLSYMIFNNKDIDIKDIYVISPTRLLSLENDELSRTLNVNSANRLAIGLFNASLVKKYYDLNKTYNHNTFERINSNTYLDTEFIKLIYSDSFIKAFKNEISDIILTDNKRKNSFLDGVKTRLLNEYKIFCEEDVKFDSIPDAYRKSESLLKYYENLIKAVSRLPIENAYEKIKDIDKSISENTKDTTLEGKREVLRILIKDWSMSDKTIRNESDKKISVDNNIFNEVFGYFNVLGKKNSGNKNLFSKFSYLKNRFDSSLQFWDKYKKTFEKLNRYEEFVSGNSLNYFSEIMNQLIIDIKNKYFIDVENIYEFEVFLHLTGCNEIFGRLHNKRTFIFIDEFQDYAFTELELYKQVFPNAIFNLFGDIKQSINAKGLNENEFEDVVDDNWMSFSINENYRNARQITEYTNSVFNMKMMPIGIDGTVKQFDIININSEIELNEDDRIALIVKNIDLYEKIKNQIHFESIKKINVIYDDDCEVKRGFLNVIPISLAKGLEFEQVFVLPNKMNDNETYVAYTRALNSLYVLNM